MDATWSRAKFIPFRGASGGSYVASGPFRGVLHTAEAKQYFPSDTSYFGHSNPPHFTLALEGGTAKVYQHFSIKTAARALENLAGGVQTNRLCAIQIEIAWTATEIAALPKPMLEMLRQWMRWVEAQTGVKRAAPKFMDQKAYGYGSPTRMSFDEWNGFNGWCGHQHVPENAHWDPGVINIDYLLSDDED
jgi:hypothetical protein